MEERVINTYMPFHSLLHFLECFDVCLISGGPERAAVLIGCLIMRDFYSVIKSDKFIPGIKIPKGPPN